MSADLGQGCLARGAIVHMSGRSRNPGLGENCTSSCPNHPSYSAPYSLTHFNQNTRIKYCSTAFNMANVEIDGSTLNSHTTSTGTFANLRDSFKRVLSPERSQVEARDGRLNPGVAVLLSRCEKRIYSAEVLESAVADSEAMRDMSCLRQVPGLALHSVTWSYRCRQSQKFALLNTHCRPTSASRSRGREFQSTGRGGAGNFVRSESVSRTREDGVGQERGREILPASKVTHSGRGGAGNIRSPSRDPEADIRALSHEREIIEDHRRTEEGQVVGPLNTINYFRLTTDGYSTQLAVVAMETWIAHAHALASPPRRSTPLAGVALVTSLLAMDMASLTLKKKNVFIMPMSLNCAGNVTAGAAPAPEIIAPSPVAEGVQWRSSGRGGAGNMKPVHHADCPDPHGVAEEGRGRKEHTGIGGFIDRLTSRSRDPHNPMTILAAEVPPLYLPSCIFLLLASTSGSLCLRLFPWRVEVQKPQAIMEYINAPKCQLGE
ncbi:hypothetical protein AG1IA_05802 [Rhizoctonia solani AG-1 IA]|uniref:Uncharacterized protein n=1 Tax=Thanatephorus cucumeris (strain AG1-IA) TaxID=983506 RepID=L8WQ90_THACA|nr:hypothetical protein AG1IA_05802 [Rhizoctonia solani AG-1 IA]